MRRTASNSDATAAWFQSNARALPVQEAPHVAATSNWLATTVPLAIRQARTPIGGRPQADHE
jgi:hypothetical protein